MELSASIMCADSLQIIRSVITLVRLGVDYFHLDIMDGKFVNNLALNFDMVKKLRKLTRIPFDAHLMVEKPSQYFDNLIESGVDIVTFHVEADENIEKNIDYLKSRGIKVGLALHLETPPYVVEKYLPIIDYVLVMNVKTGFASQKFHPSVFTKVNYLYSIIKKRGYKTKIIDDGGITLDKVEDLYNNGVDIFVGGTSMLFNDGGFSNNVAEFRAVRFNSNKRINKDYKSAQIEYDALVLEDVNQLSLQRKKLRLLRKDEVIVKVMSCGICGSDFVRAFKSGAYSKNLVLGHEFSGIVSGSKNNEELINQRVAVYPLIPCKSCSYCLSQKHNLCESYDYLGSRCDGGMAEYAIVPKDNLVPIPDNVSFDEAAMLEPLAVAFSGVSKLDNIVNSDVLILGLGPIGLLSGMVCKKLNAKRIVGIDRNDYKCSAAIKIGFDVATSPGKIISSKKFSIILDCSGSSDLFNKYLPFLGKQGTVLLLANHETDFIINPKTMSSILRGETKILSSWNSNHIGPFNNDWRVCLNYLSRKELNLKPVITHLVSLKNSIKVFEDVKNKKIKSIKIIVHPNKNDIL